MRKYNYINGTTLGAIVRDLEEEYGHPINIMEFLDSIYKARLNPDDYDENGKEIKKYTSISQ